MCGIVGLFLKDEALEPRLDAMLSDMLRMMTDRDPDGAGFAVYGNEKVGRIKLTLRGEALETLAEEMSLAIGDDIEAIRRDSHMVLALPADQEQAARDWLAQERPDVIVIGAGRRIELYKEVGLPADLSRGFGLSGMRGSHGMAEALQAGLDRREACCKLKMSEWNAFTRHLTQWERDTTLDC